MEYKIAVIPGDGIGPEVVRADTESPGPQSGTKFGHDIQIH